jgi:hypothetical protein
VVDAVTCRCGDSIDLCVKCWDSACPAPVCFSCLLVDSGVTRAELPELVNAVRPARDSTQKPGRHARRVGVQGRIAPNLRRAG